MAKILKILGRIVGISIEWILIFVTVLAFAIRTSPVQTYLAKIATDYLSKELKTTMRIDRVSIVFIDRVALDGVFILDQQQDTLASIGRIYAQLNELDLNKNIIGIEKVELEKGNIHLSRAKEDGAYNYWFITDYFASSKKSTKKKPFAVTLETIELSDVNFHYDDYRKSYSNYGVDFDHISLKHFNLKANNFNTTDGVVKFDLLSLNGLEQSGFKIDNLSSNARISKNGILLSNLKIKTPLSTIDAPKLNLLMSSFEDFQTFEDSVSFDAQLNQSLVSMRDISMFASQLKGMDQMVNIKGKVTEKVKNLKLRELELSTGKKTKIRGDLNLPDFRNLKAAFFSENLDYAYIDLNDLGKIKLPDSNSDKYLTFDKYLHRLVYFEASNVKLDGFYSQFVLAADKIKTSLGQVKMDNGMLFTVNPSNESLFFERSQDSDYDVKIEEFNLGKFLGNNELGIVDGTVFLSGEAFSTAHIDFNLIEGHINRFDYLNYSYNQIDVSEGKFKDNIFTAKIDVKDDNLDLTYNGYIDFNGGQHMRFTIDLKEALLDRLNIGSKKNASLTSNFTVNIFGKTANTMYGSISMDGMLYTQGDREIRVPELLINVKRGPTEDEFKITSGLGNFNMAGKIDFTTLVEDFLLQFEKVFPGLIEQPIAKQKKKRAPSHFRYDFLTNDLDNFLAIFVPDLKISPKTSLKGTYDGANEDFTMKLNSGEISYQDMKFTGVKVDQTLTAESIIADYKLERFSYGDSIKLDNVIFITTGMDNILESEVTWNPETTNSSDIKWQTTIYDNTHLKFLLKPSYFSINEQRWEIENQSDIELQKANIKIENFKLKRDRQYISLDGNIARNDSDRLNFRVNDLDLAELGAFIGSKVEMKGLVNGWGYISNPYENLNYVGDASIQGLYINQEEVGDVFVQSQWNKGSESIGMTGDLMYRGNQTFEFQGSYFTEREENNLDFNLIFDETDIQFTSAFLDPDLVTNVKGLLNGSLKVTGSPENPKLDGRVNLQGGNGKLALLGVNFGFNGEIIADEYGFYINNMPVTDEEGNTGGLIGSVYHTNYKNWNFDLQFNLEGEKTMEDENIFSWSPTSKLPERFLLMNTDYKEGEYYYGKAYGTGFANIYGYSDNIEITVDMKTSRGTKINFPMYGVTDISEEESFIRFVDKDTTIVLDQPKFDFTGVDLNLNFSVTPDAKLKIIFNEQTGDEITATGKGDINMKLDNLGDLTLDGTYRIKEGLYNFAMGPIKQPFYIQEGGTIAWTGDPYNANIDLKTYYKVNASLSEISPDELQGTANMSTQEILCYLDLTESLLKPNIGFDIKAPKANETGKALLSRITSDPDELNRQFFSLLLWKRFQPLKGSTAAGGSAALDLVANQINSMLALVSKEYKMNVNIGADNLTGENSLEFGVTKGFLDDRLIFTGSFGVENNIPTGSQNQSMLIGDVSVEYLLNESGTFRVNIFNESNDYSIIQDKNLGLFTQGAGINYQEDFDNVDNFMLVQYFLDVFRKKEKKRITVKRKKQQTPIPKAESPPVSVLNEED